MTLPPDQRKVIVKAVKNGKPVTQVAEFFGVSRFTIYHWLKRSDHRGTESFKNKPRGRPEVKITLPVELFILSMRTAFRGGTARIQQGLIKLPDYMLNAIPDCVQGLELSRSSIKNYWLAPRLGLLY